MKKAFFLFLLLTAVVVKFSSAQNNEIYLKSNFLTISNGTSQNTNLNNFDQSNSSGKTIDLVLGLAKIKKNNTQSFIGFRVLRSASTYERKRDNDAMLYQTKNTSEGISAGLEAGVGKRIELKQLLFIPSFSLSLYHSLSGSSTIETIHFNKINNLNSHSISNAIGGENFAIATNFAQGMYYKLGQHWKIGIELNAQLGFTKNYGNSIQTTNDLINNQISTQYIIKLNDKRISLGAGIQLGVRYTL